MSSDEQVRLTSLSYAATSGGAAFPGFDFSNQGPWERNSTITWTHDTDASFGAEDLARMQRAFYEYDNIIDLIFKYTDPSPPGSNADLPNIVISMEGLGGGTGGTRITISSDMLLGKSGGGRGEYGDIGYVLLLHEIGHALFAKDFETDSTNHRFSVMSYNPHPGVFATSNSDPTTAKGYFPVTPMPADLKALQEKYGYNSEAKLDPLTNSIDNVYEFSAGSPTIRTIFDSGGNDTIDAGNQLFSALIDLRPGYFSSIGPSGKEGDVGAEHNVFIAGISEKGEFVKDDSDIGQQQFLIENAIGGAGGDIIIGNSADNTLYGGAGDDTLYGGSGNDTLIGGLGKNELDGGDDTDTVVYSSVPGLDRVTVDLQAGKATGVATFPLRVIVEDKLVNIEDVTGTSTSGGGSAADVLLGDNGPNVLRGLSGNDRLDGRGGDDTLYGGSGNDVLSGGLGKNFIDGGSGIDTVTYFNTVPVPLVGVIVDLAAGKASGTSLDSRSVFEDTLRNVENVIGTSSSGGGAGRDFIWGNHQDNRLEGRSGNDFLSGRAGDDTLLGGSGKDVLAGGSGKNYLYGGRGTDTVQFDVPGLTQGVAVDLSANRAYDKQTDGRLFLDHIFQVEDVQGTRFADTIVGDRGNNKLTGNQGDDTLTGGGGKDTFSYLVAKQTSGSSHDGRDTITDFIRAEDVLELRFFFEPTMGQADRFTFATLDSNGDKVIDGGDFGIKEIKDGDRVIGLRLDLGLVTDQLFADSNQKIGKGVATIDVIGPTQLVDAGIVAPDTVYLT
jgi:Ca2+-binding RTX toxin-like protein